jgi:hypothetical protein
MREATKSTALSRARSGYGIGNSHRQIGLFSSIMGRDKRQRRTHSAPVLEPGMLRTVDLHQFAQTVPPPTRLMRRGQAMATVLP